MWFMDDLWSKLQEFTIISTWKFSKSSSTNHCSFHDFYYHCENWHFDSQFVTVTSKCLEFNYQFRLFHL